MTSINYNVAANTALRTLQQTNSALETSQNRVATGLKIGEAKDNAAYWSISTTLKSDNKSLSTIKDALNLGGATVDVAYQGLNKTLEVVNEIKSKLTAATQDGVDRVAIQSEITELQNQLKSIATSSSFSGENWLSVNSGVSGYTAQKTVVSSISRDLAGNFSIGTIDVDTSSFALIDGSANAEGILDAGKVGNSLVGGLASMATKVSGTATNGTSTQAAAFAYTAGTGAGFDKTAETLALAITVDSSNFAFTITDSNKFDTIGELANEINQRLGSAGTASDVGGVLTIKSATTGATSIVNVTAATFTGTGATTASTLTGVATNTGVVGTATAATTTMAGTFGTTPIVLDNNDSITFQLELNGAASKTITIDRDTITTALGTASAGRITTASQYASVLNSAIQGAGFTTLTADVAGSNIRLTSTVLGADSDIRISSVTPNKGTSILNLDVTNASKVDLAKYLNVVSNAASAVTTAASTLGAVSARVELQNTFVDTLIDTIDKGVSGLIDADLSEESTKLQALQTKQQLGIQALSIANSSTQNILALFRS